MFFPLRFYRNALTLETYEPCIMYAFQFKISLNFRNKDEISQYSS